MSVLLGIEFVLDEFHSIVLWQDRFFFNMTVHWSGSLSTRAQYNKPSVLLSLFVLQLETRKTRSTFFHVPSDGRL